MSTGVMERLARPVHEAFLGAVWHLPEKVVYWCVIRAAERVEPNEYQGDVTVEQMLQTMEPGHPPQHSLSRMIAAGAILGRRVA